MNIRHASDVVIKHIKIAEMDKICKLYFMNIGIKAKLEMDISEMHIKQFFKTYQYFRKLFFWI